MRVELTDMCMSCSCGTIAVDYGVFEGHLSKEFLPLISLSFMHNGNIVNAIDLKFCNFYFSIKTVLYILYCFLSKTTTYI